MSTTTQPSRLQKLKDAKVGSGTPMETIAIRVESYDTSAKDAAQHVVVGTRLDIGEKIRVMVRPDQKAAERKNKRAEIADWAAKKGKMATAAGGVIRFDRAFPVRGQEGVWSAGWGVSQVHDPKSGEQVVMGMARVLPAVKIEDKALQSVELLKTDQAVAVSSADELKAAIVAALSAEMEYGSPRATIRAVDGDDAVVRVLSLRVRVQNGNREVEAPEAAAKRLLETDLGKSLLSLVDEGVQMEVIPTVGIGVGRDTVTNALEGRGLERRYKVDGAEEPGYAMSLIAVSPRENGSFFAKDASPVYGKEPVYTARSLPTAAHGAVAKAEVPAPAAAEGQDDLFDGADVDELEAAAASYAKPGA